MSLYIATCRFHDELKLAGVRNPVTVTFRTDADYRKALDAAGPHGERVPPFFLWDGMKFAAPDSSKHYFWLGAEADAE